MESRPLEDAELVERARGGDTEAYTDLVRRYRDVAVRTAYVVAGAAEAEDAAQEAFVKAYRALGGFRRGAAFRPWLLRIVANEAKNRVRATGRREALAVRAGRDHSSGDAAPSTEAVVLVEEERRALLDALNGASEEDRLVIGYRYFLEMSEREMAEALGVAPGTVKSRLSRALGRLRERMATETPDA